MYVSETLLFTWGGQIGSAAGSAESWQCGVKFASTPGLGSITWNPSFDLGPAYEKIKTAHASPSAPLSSGCVLNHAKLAHLDLNGHYMHEPIVYQPETTTAGSATPGGAAPQLAVAVTLDSGFKLGSGNLGRFYVPWPVATVQNSNGKIFNAASYLTTWFNAIRDVEAALGSFNVFLVIASTKGTTRPVTKIRVGDVLDTQRRRRNRIPETYTAAAYPSASLSEDQAAAEAGAS